MGCVSSADEPDVEGVEWRIVNHDPSNSISNADSKLRQSNFVRKDTSKRSTRRRKKSSMIIPEEIGELVKRLDSMLVRRVDQDCLITSQDVYNMLNDGGLQSFLKDPDNMLLLDTRDEESYSIEHVVTACHVTCLDHKDIVARLGSFTSVIVYGYGIYDNESLQVAIEWRERLTSGGVCDVFFLVDNYKSFRSIYRFMCTDYALQSAWERRALQIYPSVILFNRLYQGRADQANSRLVVENLNITHIVSLGQDYRAAFEDRITYLNVPVKDTPADDILQHFEVTTNFIANALDHNGCILVHCSLGISRSSAVVLAFLMKHNQWSLSISYEYLKSSRSCIAPNSGFLEQLSLYEAKLFGSRLTNISNI